MNYVFGKAFNHSLYFRDVDGNSLLPQESPVTAYLYDEQPSRDQVENGSGSPIETVASWSAITGGYKVAFAAVDDPDPDGSTAQRSYWVGIKYRLQSGEQDQIRIEEIWLARAISQNSTTGVNYDEIRKVHPAITAYMDETKIQGHIDAALETMQLDLLAAGYRWAQVREPWRYKTAHIYKTLEVAFRSQRMEEGDRFHLLADDYGKQYASAMKKVKSPYDSDADGVPDAKAEKPGYAINLR